MMIMILKIRFLSFLNWIGLLKNFEEIDMSTEGELNMIGLRLMYQNTFESVFVGNRNPFEIKTKMDNFSILIENKKFSSLKIEKTNHDEILKITLSFEETKTFFGEGGEEFRNDLFVYGLYNKKSFIGEGYLQRKTTEIHHAYLTPDAVIIKK